MTNLHFNFKDVFRAGRLGFSAKKMWVVFVGLLVAFIGYDILTYIAYMVSGSDIGSVWDAFRLVPMYPADFPWPWFAWIIYAVGVLWWICVNLITGTAVSKITYEQLKGDEFYEIREAVKFAMKNGKSAIAAPFVLILFIISLLVMGLILALITRIPYFGQLFLTVMAIPAFFVSIFILYLLVVTVVSLTIGPSIVGATGNDTFDTLFESFSVINDQPWRYLVYEFLLKLVIVLGVGILGFFAAKAVFLGNNIIGLIVPADKLENIMANAAYYVKLAIPPIYPEWVQVNIVKYIEMIGMPNLLFPPEYMASYESWTGAISSFVLGIIYYLIVLGVASLSCAIYWAGNTVIFTVLVRKKDDKNLLEIKEEIFEEKKDEKQEEKPAEEKKIKRPRKKEEESEKPADAPPEEKKDA
ncbi:MAG TPA: hypothetical protein VF399_08750 [bacterium]